MYWITADPHGNFRQIRRFAKQNNLDEDDVIIVLGDAGVNYYLDDGDDRVKRDILTIPSTVFCIHGNHEARPESLGNRYSETKWHNGSVFIEESIPNLLFAKDGEVYDLDGLSAFVMGGAYSIDKYIRLISGWRWFEDEQPSEESKTRGTRNLDERNWSVDVVLSHTCPYSYEPKEAFIEGIDQTLVDKSTELWLDDIERKLDYKRWYCGHWHISKQVDKIRFMFHEIEPFGFE